MKNNPFQSQIFIRWILGILSCLLLAASGYTIFSDAPGNPVNTVPLLVLVLACALHLVHLERKQGRRTRRRP